VLLLRLSVSVTVKSMVRVMVGVEVRDTEGMKRLDAKRLRYEMTGSHGSYF